MLYGQPFLPSPCPVRRRADIAAARRQQICRPARSSRARRCLYLPLHICTPTEKKCEHDDSNCTFTYLGSIHHRRVHACEHSNSLQCHCQKCLIPTLKSSFSAAIPLPSSPGPHLHHHLPRIETSVQLILQVWKPRVGRWQVYKTSMTGTLCKNQPSRAQSPKERSLLCCMHSDMTIF